MYSAHVKVSLTDLRREPILRKKDERNDPLQETELLAGERVNCLEEIEGWARVEALEQQRALAPYPGWVQAAHLTEECFPTGDPFRVQELWTPVLLGPHFDSGRIASLSYGTQVPVIGEEGPFWQVRLCNRQSGFIQKEALRLPERSPETLVHDAKKFLNLPYIWGGRSGSGVDCSGFVDLLYRLQGVALPRNAIDQAKQVKSISREELELGDLVFLADAAHPQKIHHVMLSLGGELLIEATAQVNCVRETSLDKRAAKFVVSFGRVEVER